MPFNKVPKTQEEYLVKRISELEAQVRSLMNASSLTVPIYDYTNQPEDAVEGQIAIMENSPPVTGGGGSSLAGMTLRIVFDGGGSAISTGIKGDMSFFDPYTIAGWTLLADQSGSIVIDIWKDVYANYPPTVADTITASAKPTITSATKNASSTLTGWTTAVSIGDTMRFNVDSCSSITRATLLLQLT